MDPFAATKDELIFEILRLRARNEELERLLKLGTIPAQVYKFLLDTIIALSTTAKEVDPDTGDHQDRVAALAKQMAMTLQLDQQKIDVCSIGAQLHDIGKIAHNILPLVISEKTLDENEWRDMKNHPIIGGRILKKFDCPWKFTDIVLDHHERLDGSGYPAGKKGDDISLETAIVCVADVVEAMSATRRYRQATPGLEIALNHVYEKKAILYHPDAVDACLAVFADGFVFPGTPCVQ